VIIPFVDRCLGTETSPPPPHKNRCWTGRWENGNHSDGTGPDGRAVRLVQRAGRRHFVGRGRHPARRRVRPLVCAVAGRRRRRRRRFPFGARRGRQHHDVGDQRAGALCRTRVRLAAAVRADVHHVHHVVVCRGRGRGRGRARRQRQQRHGRPYPPSSINRRHSGCRPGRSEAGGNRLPFARDLLISIRSSCERHRYTRLCFTRSSAFVCPSLSVRLDVPPRR